MKLQHSSILTGACSAFFILGYVTCSARAGVLCEEPLRATLPGIYSNADGQQVAVPFSVAARASITHITWYGFWSGPEVESQKLAATSTEFNIRLFPDSSGEPGATPLFDKTIKAKVQVTKQKLNLPKNAGFDGRVIYRFDADILPVIPIDAGKTCFLSIIAPNSKAGQWLWARSALDSSRLKFRSLSRGVQWSQGTRQGQTAFTIEGNAVTGK